MLNLTKENTTLKLKEYIEQNVPYSCAKKDSEFGVLYFIAFNFKESKFEKTDPLSGLKFTTDNIRIVNNPNQYYIQKCKICKKYFIFNRIEHGHQKMVCSNSCRTTLNNNIRVKNGEELGFANKKLLDQTHKTQEEKGIGFWNKNFHKNMKENKIGIYSEDMYDSKICNNPNFKMFEELTPHRGKRCLICNPLDASKTQFKFRKCINGKDHECLHVGNSCSICDGWRYVGVSGFGFTSPEWRIFDQNIECNPKCRNFNDCKEKDKNLKNKNGWCEYGLYLSVKDNGFNNPKLRIFDQNIECNKNCENYEKCDNKNKVLKNYLGWCEDIFNHWRSKGRKNFYNNYFNIVAFESLDHETKLEDFDKLSNKIGVWSRWTDENHGNYCLDVCKSNSIGKEMLSSLRYFDSLLKNPDQILDTGWKRKYKNQLIDAGGYNEENPGKIIFKLVTICENEEEALKIEAQYAHDNKAKYWYPEPGQRKIVNF